MEGFAGANIDQLISIAAKVVAKKRPKGKRKKYLETKAKILAMAFKEGGGQTEGQRGGPNRKEWKTSLGKNKCAYCKEEGHWKNECPNKGKKGGCIGKMNALTREKKVAAA
jgi:hypothetical protein